MATQVRGWLTFVFITFLSLPAVAQPAPAPAPVVALPVALPPIRPWIPLLKGLAPLTTDAEVAAAWRAYVDHDLLGARMQLSALTSANAANRSPARLVAALSLGLLAKAPADELVSAAPRLSAALASTVSPPQLQPDVRAWVSVFDGAQAYAAGRAEVARDTWSPVTTDATAPPLARALASLGFADLELENDGEAHAEQLAKDAERWFGPSASARQRAAVDLIAVRAARVRARRTTDQTLERTAADALRRLRTFCEANRLDEVLVELDLLAARVDTASDDRAPNAWSKAEARAVASGLVVGPTLTAPQLKQLYAYSNGAATVTSARAFDAWAAATGNTIAIDVAKRQLSKALTAAGDADAAQWHGALGRDLIARTAARLPASTLWLAMARLDYELLAATAALERGAEPWTGTNYTRLAEDVITTMKRFDAARGAGKESGADEVYDEDQAAEFRAAVKLVEQVRTSAFRRLTAGDRAGAAEAFAQFFERLAALNEGLPLFGESGGALPPRMVYVAGVIGAYLKRSPASLSDLAQELGTSAPTVNDWAELPHLLGNFDIAAAATRRPGAAVQDGTQEDAPLPSSELSPIDALRAAMTLAGNAGRVAWPSLLARRAAEGTSSAIVASAILSDAQKTAGRTDAERFGLIEIGQTALARSGDIPFVRLQSGRVLDRIVALLGARGDQTNAAYDYLNKLSAFSFTLWLSQLSVHLDERFLQQLRDERSVASLVFLGAHYDEFPELDFLFDDDDDENDDEQEKARLGAEMEMAVWGLTYPVAIYDLAFPEQRAGLVRIASALARRETQLSSGSVAPGLTGSNARVHVRELRMNVLFMIGVEGLLVRNYTVAAARFTEAASLLAPDRAVELAQLYYFAGLAHRGLGDAVHEEASLKRAVDTLERSRRSLPTRHGSLRLRTLRLLLHEEYVGTLHRRGATAAMLQEIARYRRASLIPPAVMGSASTQDPALQSLRSMYDRLSREGVPSPFSRENATEFAEFFEIKSVPPGDPVLNAIDGATDFVVDELASTTTPPGRTGGIRPAARGELIVLQSVGREGIHSVSVDEAGRQRRHYLAIPQQELARRVRQLTDAIESEADERELAAQMYSLLLGGFAELAGKSRLSILADGPLQTLPWQALRRTAAAQPLIADIEIGVLSGAPLAGPVQAPQPARLIVSDEASLGRAASTPGEWLVSAHAESDRLRPNYSYVDLGDRRVYSVDFREFDLRGRRVFFAACLTRDADSPGGVEPYSLADAALARDASSALATLWLVGEVPTQQFADAFYEASGRGDDTVKAAASAARKFLTRPTREWAAYQPVSALFPTSGASAPLAAGATAPSATADELSAARESLSDAVAIRNRAKQEYEDARMEGLDLTESIERLWAESTEARNVESALNSQQSRFAELKLTAISAFPVVSAVELTASGTGARVDLRVTINGSGRLAGATVRVSQVGSRAQATFFTNRDGEVLIPGLLSTQKYDVVASIEGYQPGGKFAVDVGKDTSLWLALREPPGKPSIIETIQVSGYREEYNDIEPDTELPPGRREERLLARVRDGDGSVQDPVRGLSALMDATASYELATTAARERIAILEQTLAGIKGSVEPDIERARALHSAMSQSIDSLPQRSGLVALSGQIGARYLALRGATIELKDAQSGVMAITQSGKGGHFDLPPVPAGGSYVLTVTRKGFYPFTMKDVPVLESSTIDLDMRHLPRPVAR